MGRLKVELQLTHVGNKLRHKYEVVTEVTRTKLADSRPEIPSDDPRERGPTRTNERDPTTQTNERDPRMGSRDAASESKGFAG